MENKPIISGFIWRFFERCGAQGVSFILTIYLARLLTPDAYGTVSLVMVFTNILSIFVDSGMGNALIQKKDADDLDFSSFFCFNIMISVALYTIAFFVSPLISGLYSDPELTPMIRVMFLSIIIAGIRNVQQAYVSRNMIFKKFFYSTIIGTIVSGVVGISMAYSGYGAWALVMQNLVNSLVGTLVLWITIKWRPKAVFSFERFKTLFSFGWKLLVTALVDRLYNNIRQLIIGKMYSTADLAYYNKGHTFPNMIITNVNASIDSVLLPTMSKQQDKINTVKSIMRRSIKTSTYVMAPLLMGLAFMAEPIISFLITDKWLPCVPYLRIFCITFMLYPIHTANLNAINAMGRSDIVLKLEIVKKTVGLIVLVSTMWFGVIYMAYSLLLTTVLSMVINSWPNKKMVNYGYLEQLKDILPGILLAVFMGVVVSVTAKILTLPLIVEIIIQVAVGAIVYIGFSMLFKIESFKYILNIIKKFLKNKVLKG